MLGYNNTIKSSTKHKPIDIALEQLELKEPIAINSDTRVIDHKISKHTHVMKNKYPHHESTIYRKLTE